MIDHCWRDSVTVQYHTAHGNFQKVQLQVNEICVFRAIYIGHSLHDFHAQGITFKGKALATKSIFQNYSQLLDTFTRLVLKTAEDFFFFFFFFAKCTLCLSEMNDYNGGNYTNYLILLIYWTTKGFMVIKKTHTTPVFILVGIGFLFVLFLFWFVCLFVLLFFFVVFCFVCLFGFVFVLFFVCLFVCFFRQRHSHYELESQCWHFLIHCISSADISTSWYPNTRWMYVI